jgi:hypothetical protein
MGVGVSATHMSLYPREKNPIPIVQEAGWAPRVGLDGCEKSGPHQALIPDRSARSKSLCRLRYPGTSCNNMHNYFLDVVWHFELHQTSFSKICLFSSADVSGGMSPYTLSPFGEG